jgi:hypothetical protein
LSAFIFYINKCKNAASRKMDRNYLASANSRWEMPCKTIGQPLGTAQRVKESRWEMLEAIGGKSGNTRQECWKATGKCLNNTLQSIGEKAEELPSRKCNAKMWQFPPFFLERHISVYIL